MRESWEQTGWVKVTVTEVSGNGQLRRQMVDTTDRENATGKNSSIAPLWGSPAVPAGAGAPCVRDPGGLPSGLGR
jgi:hypothetical protein